MKNILFWFFILCFSYPAQAQVLRTYIDKDSLSVGDSFKIIVTVDKSSRFTAVEPPDSTVWGNTFEYQGMQRISNDSRDSIIIKLQFFAFSDTLITPKRFKLYANNDSIYLSTPPIQLYFKTFLTEENANLRPLKPIFLFGVSMLPWLILLLVLGILSYILFKYRKRFKIKPKAEPLIPVIPRSFINPITILESKLEQIGNGDALQNHAFKSYYSELSDAIRDYFEMVYTVPALELSTSEFRILIRTHQVDTEMQKLSLSILQDADMVKFAKFTPTISMAKQSLDQSWEFCKIARKLDRDRILKAKQAYENAHTISSEDAHIEQDKPIEHRS